MTLAQMTPAQRAAYIKQFWDYTRLTYWRDIELGLVKAPAKEPA